MTASEKKTTAAAGTTAIVPTVDDAGEPVFVLLAKRTYDIRPNGAPTPTAQAIPLSQVDRYYEGGDPETTTVQYESEVAAFKLATDFVVIAAACAPGGRPVTHLDAAVEIG